LVANNTIAIILCGSLARDLTEKFKLLPHRVAYIIDTFSCVFQGLIPYGAQLLLVCKMAQITPLEVMGQVYYCYVLGGVTLLEIFWYHRKRGV
jgi:Na+/H+ antiporter NhaC